MKPPPDQSAQKPDPRPPARPEGFRSSEDAVPEAGAPIARLDALPDESPGVPGFRTWRGIYLFVFVSFVLVVVLLALFSRVFA